VNDDPLEDRPVNEVNAIVPSSLSHLESKSQKAMLDLVRVTLDVCFQDGSKFPHTAMFGGPGLGKSCLAQTIASELAVPYKEVTGLSLRSVSDLNSLLLSATDKSIIFIDESDTMGVATMTQLMVALTSGRLSLSSGGGVRSLPLADFTLLLATTEEYGLLQPLRDRMRLTLRFQFYCEEDLQRMVEVRARSLGWNIADECVKDIARMSRGTPRVSFNILQTARYVSRSDASDTILPVHLGKACELSGIDPLGLNVATDLAYMRLIADGDKPLNVIASCLGLPGRTISTVIEPFLLRSGLIEKGKQSRRTLTPKGREHLQGNSQ
jgi:Holliday junction DNA helicase RuvB